MSGRDPDWMRVPVNLSRASMQKLAQANTARVEYKYRKNSKLRPGGTSIEALNFIGFVW